MWPTSMPTRASREKSRSAVLHKAVRALRATELGGPTRLPGQTWAASGEAEAWEPTVADGPA